MIIDSNPTQKPGPESIPHLYHNQYRSISVRLSRETLANEQSILVAVTGASMAPILQPGDRVTVKKSQPQEFRSGDLIVFEREGDWITHRLLSYHKDRCYTKGDNCFTADPPITEDMIVGKVINIYRNAKTIDIQAKYWLYFNRLLGGVGRLEVGWYNFAKTALHMAPFLKPMKRICLCLHSLLSYSRRAILKILY